jgi:hypothetical protein
MLKEIEKDLDYKRWWRNNSRNLDYPLIAQSARPEVREAAYRFIRDDPVDKVTFLWQVEPAQAMAQSLQKWGVKGIVMDDSQKRPWLVFAAYFYFLSREDTRSKEDMRSAKQSEDGGYASAVWAEEHLPLELVRPDGCFGTDQEELTKQLAALARKLRSAPDSGNATELVRAIDRSLGLAAYPAFLLNRRRSGQQSSRN